MRAVALLAHDAIVRTNRCAIAMCSSVCLSGTGAYCDHTVDARGFKFMVE